ncbi:hypothetical protein [Sphingobium sp. YBL2]|uniref:hypothetical protein n=1 Tax=Sphingobium sp. (strain YBL2) TaxID=484429 RepID=UPI0005CBC9E0|nr:hypothetical protein [Sphingobium sp. YBL2]AJR24538.1 hypothetical protein TZ53_13190 [Sphingobium sp. YBL2]
MTVYPATPGGYAIFCDDIREELGGKISLMGIYTGELLLQNIVPLPVNLPQICCQVNILMDPEELPETISIQLKKFAPDGSESVVNEFDLPPIRQIAWPERKPSYGQSKPLVFVNGAMKIAPLLIESEYTLRCFATIDGNEHHLGNLTIRIVDQLPNGG